MAQAEILINGVAASDDDLPINALVVLDNQNNGGETTFLWEIIDQPAGPPDTLASAVVQNTSFTPKKEGTYLLQLTVNGTFVDRKIAAVRQLISRIRIPAAQEQVEDDATRGWAESGNSLLQLLDLRASNPGAFVGVLDPAFVGTPFPGDVVRATSTQTIKAGLPGETQLVGWAPTNATVAANVDQDLGVIVGTVDSSIVPPYAGGTLIVVRMFGLYQGLVGSPLTGAPVYVSNVGLISDVPGTALRQIGNVTRSGGGTYDVFLDGSFNPSTPLFGGPPLNVTKSPGSGGVGPAASRFDHKHDISTAAPGSIAIGDVAAEGVATTIARSDHKHALAAPAAPVNVTKAAAAAGVSTTPAREDHKHDVTTAAAVGIAVGDANAEGVSTSLSRADHVHAVPAPAAPVDVTKAAASAGVSTNVARADHKHDVTTATPVAIGTANAEGVATTLARSDHVHKGSFLQTVFNQITVDTTTASAVFVTLLSQAITIQAGSVLLVHFTTGVSNSNANNTQFFRVQVDAVTQRAVGTTNVVANGPQSAGIVLRITGLAAGSRTVTIQWRTSGNTAQIRPATVPDAEHASLLLTEVTV